MLVHRQMGLRRSLLSLSRRGLPSSALPKTVRSITSLNSNLDFFQRKQLPVNTIIKFVPQQTAWVVERMGKFNRILDPGLAILIPLIDKIKYVQSLKEKALEIPSQSAITSDNVNLEMDGVLYLKIFDAYKASYGVEDPEFAVAQLAQTTMRSEIGQLTLDHVLRERQQLNSNITQAINEAAKEWGIQCLRYEIRDIHPPAKVLEAMHTLVSAERSKRATILESEGHRQSEINVAEGSKQSKILASEANKQQLINAAAGDAQAILAKAQATAKGIEMVAKSIKETPGGTDAVRLQVAERYVDAFAKLAKESNTVVVPSSFGDVGSWIAGGLTIFDKIKSGTTRHGGDLSSVDHVTPKSSSTHTGDVVADAVDIGANPEPEKRPDETEPLSKISPSHLQH